MDGIKRYTLFHQKSHPKGMGTEEILAFITSQPSPGHTRKQPSHLSLPLFYYRPDPYIPDLLRDRRTQSFGSLTPSLALMTFIVYLKTLAPSIYGYDSAELVTGAYTLGIVHPPGYPLSLLVGKLFTYLPIGNIAYRLNFMSAVFGCMTVLFLYYYVVEGQRNDSHIFNRSRYDVARSYFIWRDGLPRTAILQIINEEELAQVEQFAAEGSVYTVDTTLCLLINTNFIQWGITSSWLHEGLMNRPLKDPQKWFTLLNNIRKAPYLA